MFNWTGGNVTTHILFTFQSTKSHGTVIPIATLLHVESNEELNKTFLHWQKFLAKRIYTVTKAMGQVESYLKGNEYALINWKDTLKKHAFNYSSYARKTNGEYGVSDTGQAVRLNKSDGSGHMTLTPSSVTRQGRGSSRVADEQHHHQPSHHHQHQCHHQHHYHHHHQHHHHLSGPYSGQLRQRRGGRGRPTDHHQSRDWKGPQ